MRAEPPQFEGTTGAGSPLPESSTLNDNFVRAQSYLQTTEAEFDQIVNVHFKGVYFLTQKLLPLMTNGGLIVNISAGSTRISLPGSSAYGVAKGAV